MRGKDIKRYSYEWAGLYLICTHNGYTDSKGNSIERIKIGEYPAIKEHLDSFGSKLIDRTDQGDTPYNLRNCAYMDDFNNPIIAWQRITQTNQFCIVDNKIVVLDSMAFISGFKYPYSILGFLNSDVIKFWIKLNVHQYGNTGFRLSNQYVKLIPIPVDNTLEIKFKELIKKNNILDLESEIYKFYKLSNEEIKYIINSTSL